MLESLGNPEPLTKSHDTSRFDCGNLALNEFLVKYALQNQTGGGSRTYVIARGNRVVGYYSLAPASVRPQEAPERVSKGQGNYPVPVILMARFAIDRPDQGKGLGTDLLQNAMRRALAGAESIGGRAFLVHAKNDTAKAFYLRFGMSESVVNPLHLFLLFKDIRKSLSESQ